MKNLLQYYQTEIAHEGCTLNDIEVNQSNSWSIAFDKWFEFDNPQDAQIDESNQRNGNGYSVWPVKVGENTGWLVTYDNGGTEFWDDEFIDDGSITFDADILTTIKGKS